MTIFKQVSLFLACFSLVLVTVSCSDSSTGSDNTSPTQFDSKKGPGQSAELFLNGDQYSELRVEIDYMPNHKPTQKGLDSLKTFLQQRLNKDNISFRTPTEISSGNKPYSAQEIRTIEENNRDNYTTTDGNVLEAYFLYVDGKNERDSNVLGFAYWNTSVAFFGQKIEEVSSSIGAPSEQKIEGTVFRHEFGHNMGLVGNGTPTQSDHKTSGSAHCTKDGCLMEAAVETGNFFENTFSGDIPALDQFCISDLQANGGR